jgi:hypothetical protein
MRAAEKYNYYLEIGRILEQAGVPVSPCRIPYTYHHDAVRQDLWHRNMDRADVAGASAKCENESEALIAGMFIQIMREYPSQLLQAVSKSEALRNLLAEAGKVDWQQHLRDIVHNS